MLDRLVDVFADVGESDDLIDVAKELGAAHAEQRGGKEDVLAAGVFRMESGTQFEQGTDAAGDRHRSGTGPNDAGNDLQQRGFAGTVLTDEAQGLAGHDIEGDVVQGMKSVADGAAAQQGPERTQAAGATRHRRVVLAYARQPDERRGHQTKSSK